MTLIVGGDELARGEVTLRDMTTRRPARGARAPTSCGDACSDGSVEHDDDASSLSHAHLRRAARRPMSAQTVVLLGWVHRVRDLGGVLFFDMRDRYGLTQVVVRERQRARPTSATRVRPEFVVAVRGTVEARRPRP